MKRRGFALWEIVAVLSVILIAAVVLYPVFFTPRESGPRSPGSACHGNLKQIGLGFRQYTQDFDEKYPLVTVNNTPNKNSVYGWADALQPYLKSTQLYQCAVEPRRATQSPDASKNDYTDYWFNRNLAGREEKTVKVSGLTIMAGDGNDGSDNTNARYSLSAIPVGWRNDKTAPPYRHEGRAIYLFPDGHVKSYKPNLVLDTATANDDNTAPSFMPSFVFR